MAVLRVGGKHEARGDRNGGLQVPGRTSGSEGQPQLQPSFLGLLVCLCCHNATVPQSAWLSNSRNLFSHNSGGWKVQDQVPAEFGFWRELFLAYRELFLASFLVHPHMAFSTCVAPVCVGVGGAFLLESHQSYQLRVHCYDLI